MGVLVKVSPEVLDDLVSKATMSPTWGKSLLRRILRRWNHGRIYRGQLAKLIGASMEGLEGKSPLYLISLMKLCGLAKADVAKVLTKSKIVSQ